MDNDYVDVLNVKHKQLVFEDINLPEQPHVRLTKYILLC